MFFSVGAHPGFLCASNIEDYVIEFEAQESNAAYRLTDDLLVSSKASEAPFEADGKTIAVTNDLFNDGVHIFKQPKSNWVALKNTKTGQSVTISFNDWKYFGIWAPPGAPFICLEPWYGIADIDGSSFDFTEKEGIEQLAGHKTFKCTHTISIA
jgi:galactose mutarotase-like enzyme